MRYQTKKSLIVIIGIKRKDPGFRYVISEYQNGIMTQSDPETISDPTVSYLTAHRAILLCLRKFLEQRLRIGRKCKKIVFCSVNSEIEFEWMTEYRSDGKFSSQTQDTDIWAEIVGLVTAGGFKLEIKGSDSVFSGMAKTAASDL